MSLVLIFVIVLALQALALITLPFAYPAIWAEPKLNWIVRFVMSTAGLTIALALLLIFTVG